MDKIWTDFNTYFNAVIKRNNETHENGHIIAYNYNESIIIDNKDFFRVCWETHISPYKALLFLQDRSISIETDDGEKRVLTLSEHCKMLEKYSKGNLPYRVIKFME